MYLLAMTLSLGRHAYTILTRVSAAFSLIRQPVPNRPVNEVKAYGSMRHNDSADLSFFTLHHSEDYVGSRVVWRECEYARVRSWRVIRCVFFSHFSLGLGSVTN